MRRHLPRLLLLAVGAGAALGFGGPLAAQFSAPQVRFTATDPLSGFPDDVHLGEVAGVARNSRGEIFVYTRTGNPTITIGTARAVAHGGSRLFRFDAAGRYQGESGAGIYGFLYAQQVRIDPQDHVWVVDRMANQVIKFDQSGRVLLVLGRKPEAINIPTTAAAGVGAGGGGGQQNPGAGAAGESFNRPTDVAWDAQGNIYVADGYTNARIAKYDRNGRWIRNWGQRGSEPGQFDVVHGIAIDADGLVYVADRGNGRVQVFDGDGNFRTQFTGLGRPSAICISPGPRQYLFVSNSNPTDDIDGAGEILVMELDGRIIGQFGRAGKPIGEFGTVNAIDCRSPTELLVGEIGNWRVQRVTLETALPR